jgi:hypothetical protein
MSTLGLGLIILAIGLILAFATGYTTLGWVLVLVGAVIAVVGAVRNI